MPRVMVWPGLTAPTPSGVPVMIKSPGRSSMEREAMLITSGMGQISFEMSLSCLMVPSTANQMRPLSTWPVEETGWIGPIGGRTVEALAPVPWSAEVFGGVLEITPGHVEADGVAPDVVEGVSGVDVAAGFADGDDQFGFVVEICGFGGIGDGGAVVDNGVGGFEEKEGWLAVGVLAHLTGVGGVVASDAEDAADGEAIGGAGDGDGRGGRWVDDEVHASLDLRQISSLTTAVAVSPVLGVLAGSISRRWVSTSATGRCSTPRGTT